MFQKILIANRGEIACRVIHTARKMGILTVAVYSEADRDALHVELADESVCIGPAPSRESYLCQQAIIEACRQTGAQAVHPGYGFLSENETFARVVEEAGIVFIGPKHTSIAAMGDKIASKKLAQQARVNIIPGHNEPILSADEAVDIARRVGYPVMIKASAGGGGKGLRVAYDDTQVREGYTSCRNEARNSFGDDRVFMEKFVESPRHIEIQILADAHGQCLYLWERECSIQRRHQKVIEEAPSPFLDDATRHAMGQQAVALAKAVQYQSAGTVEFVVGKDKSFYFLEMNTRLQVEHPVTECITGLDLVEQMIRVAAGERLSLRQEDVPRQGWAMECRINAEDPARNFLPSTGRLVRFEPPLVTLRAAHASASQGGGVRVDTGVQEGGEIPMHYDSMIAKLITHGRTREEAMAQMRDALNAFVIRGITSNIAFQSALLNHPQFISGDFHTGLIAEHFPKGYVPRLALPESDTFLTLIAAAFHRRLLERTASISGQLRGHERHIGEDFVVVHLPVPAAQGATPQEAMAQFVRLEMRETDCVVWLGEVEHMVRFTTPLRSLAVRGRLNDHPFALQIDREGLNYRLQHAGVERLVRIYTPRAAALRHLMPHKAAPDTSKLLLSPMPGLLAQLCVSVGQSVRAGEKLAIIEAMKMENTLVATQDGVVKQVKASKGDSLAVDQVILMFE